MSKALSTLAVGSLVCFYENSGIQLYELAGFNVHGANTATLVRKYLFSTPVQFSASGSRFYSGSDIDVFAQNFESRYSVQHRAALLSTPITCISNTIGTPWPTAALNRKVFVPSFTEFTGSALNGANENSRLTLYSSAFISKTAPDNASITTWWTRSPNIDGANYGSPSTWNSASPGGYRGFIPAFVLPSSALVSDSVISEGGYLPTFYGDLTPGKPVLVSPVNAYVEVDKDITFEWQHAVDTGTEQTKADLEYSVDGGAWTSLTTVTGSAQSVVITAGTFSAGNLRWRAHTYNTDNVAGDWSDPASFVGVGAPAAPTISGVTAASRPTVSWQAIGQVAYQVQFISDGDVIHDSGETGGTAKAHVIPLYLANGTYTVRVRIENSLLMWSVWAELAFTLAVTPPDAPSLSVDVVSNGALITISDAGDDTAHLYLLRDDIPIAEVTGLLEYYDYAALGEAKYVLRAVDANENYADSTAAWTAITVPSVALAAVDDLDNVITMHQKPSGQPAVSRQKQLVGTSSFYAGRKHPLHVFSEFSGEVYTPSYFYTSLVEWQKLDALIDRRQTVLYRDAFGNRYYGAITAVNDTQEYNMISFALTIERVDYVEEISYAGVGA